MYVCMYVCMYEYDLRTARSLKAQLTHFLHKSTVSSSSSLSAEDAFQMIATGPGVISIDKLSND